MARRPVNSPYSITTEFGVKDSNAFFGYHSGVDYGVARNTPIYAPAAGQIVYAALNQTGGNMVILFDGQFYHRLMHNTSMAVSVNQRVSEGQAVAYAGDTGLAFGVHCHWDIMDEIISSATPRPTSFAHFKDPAKWLAGNYVVTQPITGGNTVFENDDQIQAMYYLIRGQYATAPEVAGWRGKSIISFAQNQYAKQEVANREAEKAALKKNVTDLNNTINQLRASKAELQKLVDQIGTLTAQAGAKQKEYQQVVKDLEAERLKKSEDTELLNQSGTWITKLLARLGVKK